MKKKTLYEDSICPECGQECRVVPLDNAFDYSATHCAPTGGTHYPSDYGVPVSRCCEMLIEDAEEIE